ncbi:MAG: glycosyltransferase family 4 protein [Coriobacteriia bacterium]|nr:glycosyltransferase family 4 protein [Coriobacteriia bacterium]
MRIGMLLIGGVFPPDIRVRKEAGLLARSGHEVHLLTTDRDGRPPREDVGGVMVHRYPRRAPWLASKLSAVVSLITWEQLLVRREIERYVDEVRPDVIHCHDLMAVRTALGVARRAGLPLVYDMHENYADAVRHWNRRPAARLFQTPARYERYERWALANADATVVVSEEMAVRARGLGARAGRLVVFGNVDDYDGALMWAGPSEPFTVVYAGGFGPHRGIDVLIEAFAGVRAADAVARLVIMGAGPGDDELRALAGRLLPPDAYEFTGWVDNDEMRSRLAASSVGVVPFRRVVQTESAAPHKLFQYMSMGLPMVVTDCAGLKRVAQDGGAGLVARADDPTDLAARLLEVRDPAVAMVLSKAGIEASRTLYSIEAAGRGLLDMYAELGPNR